MKYEGKGASECANRELRGDALNPTGTFSKVPVGGHGGVPRDLFSDLPNGRVAVGDRLGLHGKGGKNLRERLTKPIVQFSAEFGVLVRHQKRRKTERGGGGERRAERKRDGHQIAKLIGERDSVLPVCGAVEILHGFALTANHCKKISATLKVIRIPRRLLRIQLANQMERRLVDVLILHRRENQAVAVE